MRPEGLEPPAYWFEASRSIQLSYGRTTAILAGAWDAILPHGLLLGDDGVDEFAEAFDLNTHLIAGPEPARRLPGEAYAGGCAGGDNIARLQSEHAR